MKHLEFKIKEGDKLYCVKGMNNIFGQPLFIEGNTYTVLHTEYYVTGIDVILDHIRYANEYADFDIDTVMEHFITMKELRKLKLEKINESR